MRKTTEHPMRIPRITAAVLIIGSLLLIAGLLYGFRSAKVLAIFDVILCAVLLIAVIAGTIVALRQRKLELERGEEEEAKKY